MKLNTDDGRPGKILSDLVALRRAIGGFQAKKIANGPQYAVKSAKELFIRLREEGDVLGMVMVGAPVHQEVKPEPTDKGSKCVITTTIRFMSSDGTYVDYVGTGGGQATDDKAAGKANTYSTKVAVLLGLSIPDAEMVDTDDEELSQKVMDLTGRINRCSTLAELKALRPELDALNDRDKESVGPVYIRANGALKGT
jgi:hypothetical protein